MFSGCTAGRTGRRMPGFNPNSASCNSEVNAALKALLDKAVVEERKNHVLHYARCYHENDALEDELYSCLELVRHLNNQIIVALAVKCLKNTSSIIHSKAKRVLKEADITEDDLVRFVNVKEKGKEPEYPTVKQWRLSSREAVYILQHIFQRWSREDEFNAIQKGISNLNKWIKATTNVVQSPQHSGERTITTHKELTTLITQDLSIWMNIFLMNPEYNPLTAAESKLFWGSSVMRLQSVEEAKAELMRNATAQGK